MKKSFYFYTSIALTIILGLVIGNYIFGWTIPTANPPSSNLPAPINTGSSKQPKEGYLAVGTTTTPNYPLEVAGTMQVWGQLISKVASGIAPFVVDSQTKVANLNVDLLDGYDSADLLGGDTDTVVGDLVKVGTPGIKRMFITSSTYTGNLGGVSGANSKCQTAANNASLGGTWKAFISDSTQKVRNIIQDRVYVVAKPTIIFNNEQYYAVIAWWGGDFFYQDARQYEAKYGQVRRVLRTEYGTLPQAISEYYWTGSNSGGFTVQSMNCNDWTSAESHFRGVVGAPYYSGYAHIIWTNYTCNNTYRLLCFED